ncbi:MAG: alkaline phosphatase family protein, partial [Myxococcales bacterium]
MGDVVIDIRSLKREVNAEHKKSGVSAGMQKIEHVVVLMLENRGFDHFMGMLYRPDQFDGLNHVPCKPKERKEKLRLALKPNEKDRHEELSMFEGLSGMSEEQLKALANPFDFSKYDFPGRAYGRDPFKIVGADVKGTVPLRIGARAANVPSVNPHEDFVHIFEDMYYGTGTDDSFKIPKLFEKMKRRADRDKLIKKDGQYRVPGMKGFVQNFGDGISHHTHKHETTRDVLDQILDIYTPDQLPMMSFLARHYAVSDLWFCSVPSQTNTNRAFWTSGSARGLVTNNFYDPFWKTPKDTHSDQLPADDGEKTCRTLFDALEENGVSWRYYSSMNYPFGSYLYFSLMYPQFADTKYSKNVPMIAQFFKDAQKGQLPAVSYIEPRWGGGPAWSYVRQEMIPRAVGNEFHPVADTICGELFVKQVYDAISQSPNWNSTLLVITFDENGGTYDHLPPWPALSTGRDYAPRVGQGKVQYGATLTSPLRVLASGADVGSDVFVDKFAEEWEKGDSMANRIAQASGATGGAGSQFGFGFDVYGVRVPTLLISPLIRPNTIFRSPTQVPFDHTSIISTILK